MPLVLDPPRFRRAVAGACLVVAPLAGIAWSMLVPPYTNGMTGEVGFIAAHPTRWWVGTYCGVAFSYLMLPAVLGLLALLRDRWAARAHLGAALALTGFAFHGTLLGFQLAESAVVLHAGDEARALAVATALFEQPAFTAVLIPVMGMFLGLAILAVALWRTRAASAWTAAVIVLALLVELLGPASFKARLFFVLLFVGLAPIGVAMVRGRTTRQPLAEPADGETPATARRPARA